MKILTFLIAIVILSCNTAIDKKISFWEQKRHDFKYHNKTEFVSDSVLRAELKSLKVINHHVLDSLIGENVYLYSWQDRDSSKNEFTVVKDDGELGIKIFYLIFDKMDSLISCKQVGGKGSEGVYWFETWTTIKNRDTLINIGAITQFYDLERHMKMSKTKGDSTFSYLVIDEKGKMRETIFKEVKMLNFGNE